MKHLFATTALAAALSVTGALAQQTETPQTETPPVTIGEDTTPAAEPLPAITPPEGYVEGEVVLTTETLQGATVYDSAGDEIGEVHGLVFANGTTSLQGGDAGAAMPEAGATPESPAASEPTPGAAEVEPEPGASDATGAVEGETASPETATPGMETEPADAAGGADTADTDRMENIGSDIGTTTPTDATTPPVQTATDAQPEQMGTAEISHAIIDVGGFLGMGEHRVAVPIGDLVVYSKDADLRIYLPWTREQLEALPEFDENAPAPALQ
ncbi:photosystem reaction center protein H [Paracoccus denitrificans]|uniref:photosystem reaction center protein H n=1 Tax=Paracoccus denitrificans TaxID=266 RepID=UPI001E46D1C7|nr:photosystem reaction center protein H [Paracoccus denitrificans]UFS64616.1 photosystem reaction center protein H [Paracoccus denitrificans]